MVDCSGNNVCCQKTPFFVYLIHPVYVYKPVINDKHILFVQTRPNNVAVLQGYPKTIIPMVRLQVPP